MCTHTRSLNLPHMYFSQIQSPHFCKRMTAQDWLKKTNLAQNHTATTWKEALTGFVTIPLQAPFLSARLPSKSSGHSSPGILHNIFFLILIYRHPLSLSALLLSSLLHWAIGITLIIIYEFNPCTLCCFLATTLHFSNHLHIFKSNILVNRCWRGLDDPAAGVHTFV